MILTDDLVAVFVAQCWDEVSASEGTTPVHKKLNKVI